MKKPFILLTLLLVFTLSSCKETRKSDELKNTQTKNKVIFKIDERTEFFRTIFNLALQNELPEDIKPCETTYQKRINEYFLPYRNHSLIQWINSNQEIGIDFSTIGLMYDKDLANFQFDTNYTKELNKYGLSKSTLDSIQPALVDFYKKSKFKQFFTSHKKYYNDAITTIEKQVSETSLFEKVMHFYQENNADLQLTVFIELTNNANNKAINFYENYSQKSRAVILANFCDAPTEITETNTTLKLNNAIKGVLYHEISHLFTGALLNKHIGAYSLYAPICNDCNQIQIKDKVDHLIVFPLQAVLSKKFDNNNQGHDFYLEKCEDIRKEIYKRLSSYNPDGGESFEKVYLDCIRLIQNAITKK